LDFVEDEMSKSHRNALATQPASSQSGRLELSLIGGFQLVGGDVPVALGGASQRLIGFVALQERPISRAATAYALWPEASEAQAHASLRSAIWRMNGLAREAMRIDVQSLDLSKGVLVDMHDAKALARRLLRPDTMSAEEDLSAVAIATLSQDLLPDWYDEWAVVEAEDWRQLRLHALETMAEKLAAAKRFSGAIAAARAASKADPLRESARALLIRIHLAEGNQSEALREFGAYRTLIRQELGLDPTPELTAQVRDLLCGGR